MGPPSGTRVPVACGCLLLSLAAASCTSSGAAVQYPLATGPIIGTPVPAMGALPIAVPPRATPVPKGCQSGLVTITHYVMETVPSTLCIKMGAVLRLMLRSSDGSWGVLVLAANSPGGACGPAPVRVYAAPLRAGKVRFAPDMSDFPVTFPP